jgi:hypothetical protein
LAADTAAPIAILRVTARPDPGGHADAEKWGGPASIRRYRDDYEMRAVLLTIERMRHGSRVSTILVASLSVFLVHLGRVAQHDAL